MTRTTSLSQWVALFAWCTFALCDGGCSGNPNNRGIIPQQNEAKAQSFGTTGSGQHLYLTAQPAHARDATVYEFPLSSGLPSTTPDVKLHTALFNVLGLAIGPDSELYVAGTKLVRPNEYSWIKVWAPGASGSQHPLRSLRDPGFGGIAVDSNNYLFAYRSVYAPGASGGDAPLRMLKAPPVSGLGASVAVDATNDVFLDGDTRAVGYANAVGDPALIAHFCWKPRDAASYAITIGPDGTEYVATNDYGGQNPQPGAILAFAPNAHGCDPVRRITTTDKPFGIITSVLATGQYLFALDDSNDSLVVLDPTKSAQVPIERVRIGAMPSGLAVGP
jgi:hypothetical protein